MSSDTSNWAMTADNNPHQFVYKYGVMIADETIVSARSIEYIYDLVCEKLADRIFEDAYRQFRSADQLDQLVHDASDRVIERLSREILKEDVEGQVWSHGLDND